MEITPSKIIESVTEQYCDKCKYLKDSVEKGAKVCDRVVVKQAPLKKNRTYYRIEIANKNNDCRYWKGKEKAEVEPEEPKRPWWKWWTTKIYEKVRSNGSS